MQLYREEPLVLIPPPIADGGPAGDLFIDWGITVSSTSGSVPVMATLESFLAYEQYTPEPASAILNQGNAAGALVLTFNSPVRQVWIGVGSDKEVAATAVWFGRDGTAVEEKMRTFSSEYHLNSLDAPFRFEAPEDEEIRRIEIGFDDPNEPEALFYLFAEFTDPPVFRRCVAQVASGPFGEGDRALQTQVSVTNSGIRNYNIGDSTASMSVEFFRSSGAPWQAIEGEDPEIRYVIGAMQSRFVQTSATPASLEQGYVCATSDYPLELAAIYRILDADGNPVSEAGIEGATPGYRFYGPFRANFEEATNTALAVANPSNEPTQVHFSFVVHPTFERHDLTVTLEPGEQRAWFIDELVGEFPSRTISGTLEIVGEQEIVATSLRTIRGVVSSSLPLARHRTSVTE